MTPEYLFYRYHAERERLLRDRHAVSVLPGPPGEVGGTAHVPAGGRLRAISALLAASARRSRGLGLGRRRKERLCPPSSD